VVTISDGNIVQMDSSCETFPITEAICGFCC
jgi:hypothetical protein